MRAAAKESVVSCSVSESRRSGFAMANSWAIAPPMEWPSRWKRAKPRSSTNAVMSAAICSTVYEERSPGASDCPWPRLSAISTRNDGEKAGNWCRQSVMSPV